MGGMFFASDVMKMLEHSIIFTKEWVEMVTFFFPYFSTATTEGCCSPCATSQTGSVTVEGGRIRGYK